MESEGSLCGFRLGSLAVCAHSGPGLRGGPVHVPVLLRLLTVKT